MAHGQARCSERLKKYDPLFLQGVKQSQKRPLQGLESFQNAQKAFCGHLYIHESEKRNSRHLWGLERFYLQGFTRDRKDLQTDRSGWTIDERGKAGKRIPMAWYLNRTDSAVHCRLIMKADFGAHPTTSASTLNYGLQHSQCIGHIQVIHDIGIHIRMNPECTSKSLLCIRIYAIYIHGIFTFAHYIH